MYYGESVIAFAACTEMRKIVRYLIKKGADINTTDSYGNTPLHMMIYHNKPDMWKYIVKVSTSILLPFSFYLFFFVFALD
jgi:ankyrin repeat protein